MLNLESIFKDGQTFSLKENAEMKTQFQLICSDDLELEYIDSGDVMATFTRKISFNPHGIFEVSVSMVETLTPEGGARPDLEEVKQEMIKTGGAGLGNLISRASLLIAQVTSSYGQTPIIMPPSFVVENGQN